jgi:hypothetical protein
VLQLRFADLGVAHHLQGLVKPWDAHGHDDHHDEEHEDELH